MSAKTVLPCFLLSTVLVVCAARSDEPPKKDAQPEMAPAPQQVAAAEPGIVTVEPPGQLSSWITYTRPECCAPVGGNGVIDYELYARTGAAMPVYGGRLADILSTGLQVQGGGRTLFFNVADTGAWTADLNLTHQYMHAKTGSIIPEGVFITNTLAPNQFLTLPVTVRNYNQTLASLSLGRECYLLGMAHGDGCKWRAGMDFGGRWGACNVQFAEIRHLTDNVYGIFGALHTDVEAPLSPCCTFIGGVRFELDWLHDQVLRGLNRPNLGTLGHLINLGVRF